MDDKDLNKIVDTEYQHITNDEKSNNLSNDFDYFNNINTDDFNTQLVEPETSEKKKRLSFNNGRFKGFGKKLLSLTLIIAISATTGVVSSIVTFKALQKSSGTNTTTTTPQSAVNFAQVKSSTEALSIPEIVTKVKPAVVAISTKVQSTFGEAEGLGTGFIFSEDGYILTNYHVIGTSDKISVMFSDNTTANAKVVNYDRALDLAVIKLQGDVKVPGIIELGDSSSLQVGEPVVAIGNPLGKELSNTVTSGIISAVDRKITASDNTEQTYLQTDAAINSGNSGGPLLNAYGQVIGINSAKISGSDSSGQNASIEGIGFAIPINIAKDKISDLTKQILKLGIYTKDVTKDISEEYNLPIGVYVQQIQEFSAAEKAGLKPGDVITEINGTKITSVTDIDAIKNKAKSGDVLSITVTRDNKDITIKLTLE